MLKNLVTLVTGGASGLGKATAERFASKGAKVVMCDLSTSNGADVAAVFGENGLFVPADVSSENDVKSLMAQTKEKFGRLDVIVNCAGLTTAFETYNFVAKRPHLFEDFQKLLTTNLIGTFNVSRLGIELLAQNQPDVDGTRGVIINTSGSKGFRACIGQVSNAAASAGIDGLTKSMAADLREQGIRVVAIAPGVFNTPVVDFIPYDVVSSITEECMKYPNRFGEPAEFARLVQRIIQNSHLNGTTIQIDAGLYVKL